MKSPITWQQAPLDWDPIDALQGTPAGALLEHVEETGHPFWGVLTHLGETTAWCDCGWAEG